MSPELLLIAFMLGALIALAACCTYEWIRDRLTDDKMRRGFEAAKRYGYLPEEWL